MVVKHANMGEYVTVNGRVRRLDEYLEMVVMDNVEIKMKDILAIEMFDK